MGDVKAAAGGLQSIEESTNTGSAAACNASVTALDGKVRSHLGGAAFASEGLEKFGKDPVSGSCFLENRALRNFFQPTKI